MSTTRDGLGSITWWGFTPAIDLFPLLSEHNTSLQHINILFVGLCDLRHVIRTLGTLLPSQSHHDVMLHFYLAEGSVEVLTREILFLVLLTEPSTVLGLQERVEMYLELVGDLHVRTQTYEYLQRTSNKLIGLVTDLSKMAVELPFVDISPLKFKERDEIESVLKFWRSDEIKHFNAGTLWDDRLRSYLGVRYDSREGVFDWDFNMKVLERTKLVNIHEYCVWREEGLAFKMRSDAIYNIPNRSLASGVIFRRGGEEVRARGYWGDIVVGPFICFGIETERKELEKKCSEPFSRISEEISVDNVTKYVHQMISRQTYKPVKFEKIYEVDETSNESEGASAKLDTLVDLRSTFHFLPLSSPKDLLNKSKFREHFSLVYISNTMVHTLTPDLSQIVDKHATLVVENCKYILELNKEEQTGFRESVLSRGGEVGFQLCEEMMHGRDNPDHFIFQRKREVKN